MHYLTDQDPEYWDRERETLYRVYPDLRPEYSEPVYKPDFLYAGLLTQYPPYSLTPKTEVKTNG
jgi:hypothetical protein